MPAHPADAVAARPPNVILIVADDLGYGDLGCYGSRTIATPRLDRMAAEGVRFTDFYAAAPFCSPSRAALLTGRLPARCGVPYVLFPAEHHGLPPEETTLPEVLKPAGYATGMVGKWHLGWRRELRPQRQGFDEYFGLLHTNDVEEWSPGSPFRQLSSFEPLTLRDGDRVVEQPVDQSRLTEQYTHRAIAFLRRHRNRPFFLYLAHTMPHVPQYASPAFAGRSRDGLYGDCVEELDASTGRILDEVRALGLAERTLVLFTSDNGAVPRNPARPQLNPRFPGRALGGSNGLLRAGKGTTFEGGVRVALLAWWPGVIAPGRVEKTPCGALDVLPTVAALAGAPRPDGVDLDGEDIADLLRHGRPAGSPRLRPHYFGPQLQAVREGRWKLILPIASPPERRLPSLWFDHQPALFERQHRSWPKPSLFDLDADPGETVDLAASRVDVVTRLHRRALAFDREFQQHVRGLHVLPGPATPPPGRVRSKEDDLSEWRKLLK